MGGSVPAASNLYGERKGAAVRRVVVRGLLMLLAPACAFEAALYPVDDAGPPWPAVCDERRVDDVCFEIEQIANAELGFPYMSEEQALDDEPLGTLEVDREGRLRYELTVTADGEDVSSVREHYLFFMTGRINEWRRAPASPPWDLRLVTRPRSFTADYEILFDFTPRGRDVGIKAVIGTVLPAKAIAGGKR